MGPYHNNKPITGSNNLQNDFALLELTDQIDMTAYYARYVNSACLPSIAPRPASAIISGWGRYITDPQIVTQTPDQLQWARVNIVSPTVCQSAPVVSSNWGPNQICTGPDSTGAGACQGDSGGPIAIQFPSGAYEVWGATSHGVPTCDTRYGTSGVWAEAWGVRSWIISVTGGGCPRS